MLCEKVAIFLKLIFQYWLNNAKNKPSGDFVIIVDKYLGYLYQQFQSPDPRSFSRTSVCYGIVIYGIIIIITLNCIFWGIMKQVSVSLDISRLQRRMEKSNTPSDSQENGESKDVNISFFSK